LYVERGGPYFTMPEVDPWDVKRDARKYAGPLPVVVHPPCGPWGELRDLYQGNEHDCAALALAAVRAFGGVMEHPHKSKFWAHAGVIAPGAGCDAWGGFTIDVDQVSWGHVARKRTRLYFVGVSFDDVAASVRTGGTPTHWVTGTRRKDRKGNGGIAPPHIKFCSSAQRRRTPPQFAQWLVHHAASAAPPVILTKAVNL
jgi:hypothetical protein